MLAVCACCGTLAAIQPGSTPGGLTCAGCGGFRFVCPNCQVWSTDPQQPAHAQLAAATTKFNATHAGH